MNSYSLSRSVLMTFMFSFLTLTLWAAEVPVYWRQVPVEEVKSIPRYDWPEVFRAVSIDEGIVRNGLRHCPAEQFPYSPGYGTLLDIPMPDGSTKAFRVVEIRTMHPLLAQKFPALKTYGGFAENDWSCQVRISLTDLGFQAMIRTPENTIYIDPVTTFPNSGYYVIYNKKDFKARRSFVCHTDEKEFSVPPNVQTQANTSVYRSTGGTLRSYRLALACTGEYSAFYGGTVSGAMSGIVASMNRVNFVYETEVSIRMNLIPNNDTIVYLNAATDPYTNNNGSTMLTENTNNLNTRIGSANFDIGHVFSTGGGGIASLNSPCTSNKARGVTGSGSPVGDAFDIDYVAHEMGHQFGGFHTFNGTAGSCGGNRSSTAAYEPGSGITIMAYAGICGVENLAPNSIAYFHTFSYDQISTFIAGTGNTCAVQTATGNTPPVISLGSPLTYTIPYKTPFQLTGSATDANATDTLTYSWEQFDLGVSTSTTAPSWNGPRFRSFNPTLSPVRVFPKLSDILNNTTTYGEALPDSARQMKFRLTVRDNRTGGGGVSNGTDTLKVNVINTGTGFAVTSPNTPVILLAGPPVEITWNVASSNLSPISCANVKISLSTDGGLTFPTVILASTPNDGSEFVTLPSTPTTTARIKIEGVGNIFFDISNTNFTIQSSSATLTSLSTTYNGGNLCQSQSFVVSFNGDGPPNSGNVYSVQLSNASGSFASPVVVGTLTSTATSGNINCTVPANVSSGSGYRLRVVSSSPVVTGTSNTGSLTSIQISGSLAATGSISGPSSATTPQNGVAFSIPAVTNATAYAWTVPPGAVIASGANTNSITVNFPANSYTGNITVTPSNACYTSSMASKQVTVNGFLTVTGAISGPDTVCESSIGTIFSLTPVSGATSYNWTLPAGAVITSGAGTASITVSFPTGSVSGTITVVPVNASGTAQPASKSIIIKPSPPAPVLSPAGPVVACTTQTLTFTPQPGVQYTYLRNGISQGATSGTISATQSGNYQVVAAYNSPRTFSSASSVFIPDNSCTGATSTIQVNSYNANVNTSSIYITFSITHTWIDDLVLFLQAPNGQVLGIANAPGGSEDNLTSIVIADSGAAAMSATAYSNPGLYKPWATTYSFCTTTSSNTTFASLGSGSLSPNGDWKLIVYDRAAQDTGRIVNWSITFPGSSYGCSNTGNTVSVTLQSPPAISSLSPTTGNAGTLVTINGSNLNGATGVQFNGTPAASFTVVNSSQITATAPAGVSSGNVQVIHPCSTLTAGTFTVGSATLTLRMFIQGFYNGTSTMVPVASPGITDTVTVELHSAASPFATVHSATSVISTSGYGSFTFPASVSGNSYYIVVRHRNALETWSKNPVLFGSSTTFDFTQ